MKSSLVLITAVSLVSGSFFEKLRSISNELRDYDQQNSQGYQSPANQNNYNDKSNQNTPNNDQGNYGNKQDYKSKKSNYNSQDDSSKQGNYQNDNSKPGKYKDNQDNKPNQGNNDYKQPQGGDYKDQNPGNPKPKQDDKKAGDSILDKIKNFFNFNKNKTRQPHVRSYESFYSTRNYGGCNEGHMYCDNQSNGFYTCNFNQYLLRACGPGTRCQKNGANVFCNY